MKYVKYVNIHSGVQNEYFVVQRIFFYAINFICLKNVDKINKPGI